MDDPVRILLIEDDPDDYLMIKGMFAAIPRGKYQLDWAATYDEALALTRQKQHDLYIVDYVLDKGDGLQLLREAFPDGCVLPVILLTARGREEVDDAALKLGVAEYFDKVDIRVPLLERALRYAINSKRVEGALRESEARFRSLVESAPDYIHVVDSKRTILQTNAAAVRGSGYQESEIIGHKLDEFLTPASQKLVAEGFQTLFEMKGYRHEIEFIRKDGSIQVMDCSGSLVIDSKNQQSHAIIIQRDITGRKQAEQALQTALMREKELNGLKSRFVSLVSHEFRSPMTVIRLTAQLLKSQRHKMDDRIIEDKLGSIIAQIDHMTALVDDVLTLSRIETGRIEFKPTPIDLNAFCRDIIESLRERYSRTHQLVYESASENIPAFVDSTLMRQIVVNLLENAFKYSSSGSTIRLSLVYEGTDVILRISDMGIGIPEKDQPHLFQPFYRAENANTIPGTGLGLSIVKQAVDLHHGSISFESKVNVGTTFVVRIPVYQKASV